MGRFTTEAERMLREQMTREQPTTCWVSFADPDRFLGAVITRVTPAEITAAEEDAKEYAKEHNRSSSPDRLDAVLFAALEKAERLGIDPGGSVKCQILYDFTFPSDCYDRLLTVEEVGLLNQAA